MIVKSLHKVVEIKRQHRMKGIAVISLAKVAFASRSMDFVAEPEDCEIRLPHGIESMDIVFADGEESRQFDLGQDVEIIFQPVAPFITQDGETGL